MQYILTDSKPWQASQMKFFVKIVHDFKTIFVKSSILDVWQGSEYASAQ